MSAGKWLPTFWGVHVPPSLQLGSTHLGPLDSQDGGSFILQNVGNHLQVNVA